MSPITNRKLGRSASLVLVAGLLAGTLWPLSGAPQAGDGLCLVCGAVGGADLLANVIAFVPLGIALTVAFGSATKATLLSLGLTTLIELLQWRLIAGRDASAADVIANTAGGALGAVAARHWGLIARPRRKAAGWLIVAWTVACAAAVIATMWMLTPSHVRYRYWSYWAAEQRGHEKFTGAIQSVELFGREVPNHFKVEPDSMPEAYRHGEVDLKLAIAGPYRVAEPAEVYRLANTLGQRANVSVHGKDVVFRPPLNAEVWRFWSPSARFSGVLASGDDEASTVLHLRSMSGVVTLASTIGDRSANYRVSFGAADVWKFILSDALVPRLLHPVLTSGWFLVVFGPLGAWSTVTGRLLLGGLLGAGAVATVAFLVGPGIAGLPAALGIHWFGAAVAFLVGMAVGHVRARGARR